MCILCSNFYEKYIYLPFQPNMLAYIIDIESWLGAMFGKHPREYGTLCVLDLGQVCSAGCWVSGSAGAGSWVSNGRAVERHGCGDFLPVCCLRCGLRVRPLGYHCPPTTCRRPSPVPTRPRHRPPGQILLWQCESSFHHHL